MEYQPEARQDSLPLQTNVDTTSSADFRMSSKNSLATEPTLSSDFPEEDPYMAQYPTNMVCKRVDANWRQNGDPSRGPIKYVDFQSEAIDDNGRPTSFVCSIPLDEVRAMSAERDMRHNIISFPESTQPKNPTAPAGISPGVIAGVVVGAVALLAGSFIAYKFTRPRSKEARAKPTKPHRPPKSSKPAKPMLPLHATPVSVFGEPNEVVSDPQPQIQRPLFTYQEEVYPGLESVPQYGIKVSQKAAGKKPLTTEGYGIF